MSYHTVGYWVGDCSYPLCEKCVSSMTTKVELAFLSGEKDKWDITRWPVRNKDGSTKVSPKGAVVMKDIRPGSDRLKPRTFDGVEITTFSEYSYGETEGRAIECEDCSKVLIEAYKCTCKSCGSGMEGELAQKLDCVGSYVYCEECLEKLVQVVEVNYKLEMIYNKLIPVHIGKKAKINLGPDAHYTDAYLFMKETMVVLANSDSPAEFKEYVDTELEKFEYLAHRGNKPALTVFRLLEKIDEITYIIDEVSGDLCWTELVDVKEMKEKVDHYNGHGWC